MTIDLSPGEPPVFQQFPKVRPPLPPAYLALYEREYLENRISSRWTNKLARSLEGWMHLKVRGAAATTSEEVLELGAGSLNHVTWERGVSAYDIVEPFRKMFQDSANVESIRRIYEHVRDIPTENQYDRILSIAVLEHMLDLPQEIALACMHLREGGTFCAGFPTEGGWLWEKAWRHGTGAAFRRRTGLDYGVLMRHEHVNTADEIENCARYFFRDVSIVRFPLRVRSLSLYTFLRASVVDRERCIRFMESRRETRSEPQHERP